MWIGEDAASEMDETQMNMVLRSIRSQAGGFKLAVHL